MRIGIFNDFHIGHTGIGEWHNRLLYDHAHKVIQKTVDALNKQFLDIVIILGDVTNNGTEEQLRSAEKLLSKLEMPWLILPGNHDREGIRSGLFNKTFSKHIPDMYREIAGIPSLFLTEYLPPVEYPRTEIGKDITEKAIAAVVRQNIEKLFIFSHFPLISQEDYIAEHKANYAKHYIDGEAFLDQLGKYISGKIYCFSAHQHWHRIINKDRFFHCITASMIEYPMEAKVISINNDKLSISTLGTACPEIASMSLNSSKWVSGLQNDRNFETELYPV